MSTVKTRSKTCRAKLALQTGRRSNCERVRKPKAARNALDKKRTALTFQPWWWSFQFALCETNSTSSGPAVWQSLPWAVLTTRARPSFQRVVSGSGLVSLVRRLTCAHAVGIPSGGPNSTPPTAKTIFPRTCREVEFEEFAWLADPFLWTGCAVVDSPTLRSRHKRELKCTGYYWLLNIHGVYELQKAWWPMGGTKGQPIVKSFHTIIRKHPINKKNPFYSMGNELRRVTIRKSRVAGECTAIIYVCAIGAVQISENSRNSLSRYCRCY